MRSSRKDVFKSKAKSRKSNHSINPFNSLKSSNPCKTTKSRSLNSKKNSQPISKLVSPMKRQKKDWPRTDQTNSHKKKAFTGHSNCSMNSPVHSLCFCGQVVSSVLSPTLSVLKIQAIFILVLCFSSLMQ